MIETILHPVLDFVSDASNVWDLLKILWIVYKTTSELISKHKKNVN